MYFRDLGYVPIDGIFPSGSMRNQMHPTINVENDDAGCGPLGPPVPGYVPGNVVIDREFIKNEGETEDDNGDTEKEYVYHYLSDDASEEEDDIDSPTSGLFARLKTITRK